MKNRRQFLKGAGASLLAPFISQLELQAAGKSALLPKRFLIFMKSSGIYTESVIPKQFKNKPRDLFTKTPLNQLDLPESLSPLKEFKSNMAIIQGLSGKMCSGGHTSWYGALGGYRIGGTHTPGAKPFWASVDTRLGRLFPAPFNNIGLAVAGKALGDRTTEGTVYPGLSAVGAGVELPYQASPAMAYEQLFGSAVSKSGDAKSKRAVKSNILDFMVKDIRYMEKNLPSSEQEKLQKYVNAFEELRLRNKKLVNMKAQISKGAPALTDKLKSDKFLIRQESHSELATAALITGVSNVAVIRLDNLAMSYDGIGVKKNVHGIGHDEDIDGMTPDQAREKIQLHHAKLLATTAKKLQSIPEGNGNMLDNTMIIYMSDAGEKHHSSLNDWPMVVIGGCGGKLSIPGHFVQYPEYGKTGHKTICNWWTTVLNAYGDPVEHFGNLDLELRKNGLPQQGSLNELMV